MLWRLVLDRTHHTVVNPGRSIDRHRPFAGHQIQKSPSQHQRLVAKVQSQRFTTLITPSSDANNPSRATATVLCRLNNRADGYRVAAIRLPDCDSCRKRIRINRDPPNRLCHMFMTCKQASLVWQNSGSEKLLSPVQNSVFKKTAFIE